MRNYVIPLLFGSWLSSMGLSCGAPATDGIDGPAGQVVASVSAPAAVACIRLTAASDTQTFNRTYPVVGGNVDLTMFLPLGKYELSAKAWETACPPSGQSPWNADAVSIRVEHVAVPALATLVFIRTPDTGVDGRFQLPVLQVALQRDRSYALRSDGVYGFGKNSDGLLGTAAGTSNQKPAKVTSFDHANESERVIQIVAGDAHTCGLRKNGEVWCIGDNTFGQLGVGVGTSSSGVALKTQFPQDPVPAIVQIAAGANHTCGRSQLGQLYCWGHNGYGQMGDLNTRTDNVLVPVEITPPLVEVRDVALGIRHTCIRSATRLLYCVGDNTYGQMGTGDHTPAPAFVTALGAGSANDKLWAGDYMTCASDVLGQVRCWGYGYFGNGLLANEHSSPLLVPELDGAVSIAIGGEDIGTPVNVVSNCAARDGKPVSCFGLEPWLLGNPDLSGSTELSPVLDVGEAQSVAIGSRHACAVRPSGALHCWGRNPYGQIGDGTPDYAPIAKRVLFDN